MDKLVVQAGKGRSPARGVYACRLPFELASRLEALHDLHPARPRSQLMVDLIALGLSDLERSWSASPPEFRADPRQAVYLVSGPFEEFRGLTHKHHLAMENAAAHEDPQSTAPVPGFWLGDAS